MNVGSSSFSLRRVSMLFVLAASWSIVMWLFSRPSEIAWDFNGWRQAETQTMALYQALPGARIWMPQIAWGGAGPSFVEAEMQIYTGAVGLMFGAFGVAEWPGQLLSLLSVAGGVVVIGWEATRRYGIGAGAIAVCAGLSGRSAILIGTAVQPDSLAFLFVAISFVAFLRYIDSPSPIYLAISMLATLVAALTKPPTLHIGITQFTCLLLVRPQLLRSKTLWFGWFSVVALSASYLVHAYSLATEFGNSFGVLSGDRKFPTWRSLVAVKLHLRTLGVVAKMGLTYAGTASTLYLVFRKKLTPVHGASLLGYAIFVLVAQRYTSDPIFSAHYHIYGLVPGMMLIAAAVSALLEERFWRAPTSAVLAGALTLVLAALSLVDGLSFRKKMADGTDAATQFMASVRQYIKPQDLLVVRSAQGSVCEPFWGGGPNNYQDPRYFYLTQTSGWVLPSDDLTIESIKKAKNNGARFYLEPLGRVTAPKLYEWLEANSKLVFEDKFGRLFLFSETAS